MDSHVIGGWTTSDEANIRVFKCNFTRTRSSTVEKKIRCFFFGTSQQSLVLRQNIDASRKHRQRRLECFFQFLQHVSPRDRIYE